MEELLLTVPVVISLLIWGLMPNLVRLDWLAGPWVAHLKRLMPVPLLVIWAWWIILPIFVNVLPFLLAAKGVGALVGRIGKSGGRDSS